MDSTESAAVATDLARDLVARLAPRELPLFPAVSRAYRESPDRVARRDDGDRTLGFGAEFAVFLTPVLLAVATRVVGVLGEILGDVLRDAGKEAAGGALRRALGREDEPGVPPPLSREHLARVREHALAAARPLVPEDQALRIADALTARLATH